MENFKFDFENKMDGKFKNEYEQGTNGGYSVKVNEIDYSDYKKKKKSNIRFGGLFNEVFVGVYIEKVIYSDPVTIVFWSDGTKTTSRVQEGDKYNKETGLVLCTLKKLVGGDQVAKLIEDWVTEENVISLKNLRHKLKEKLKNK